MMRWITVQSLGYSEEEWMTVTIEEWLGVQLFKAIQGTVQVIRANYGISASNFGLEISRHFFYINRLFRGKGHESEGMIRKHKFYCVWKSPAHARNTRIALEN